jgi:hypothetical protein
VPAIVSSRDVLTVAAPAAPLPAAVGALWTHVVRYGADDFTALRRILARSTPDDRITGVIGMRVDEGSNRTLQVSTRLEPELVRAVEQRARAQRRTVSNFIANVIAAAVGQDGAAA